MNTVTSTQANVKPEILTVPWVVCEDEPQNEAHGLKFKWHNKNYEAIAKNYSRELAVRDDEGDLLFAPE